MLSYAVINATRNIQSGKNNKLFGNDYDTALLAENYTVNCLLAN